MGSTINGQALFDSGPQRFTLRPLGKLSLPPLTLDALQHTTVVVGNLELRIEQTGRLIGTDDDDLWDQIELIQSRAETSLTGTLVLPSGRMFTGMTLLRMKPLEGFRRGRVVSMSYEADYIRFG